MKKFLIGLLAICLILSGCTKGKDQDSSTAGSAGKVSITESPESPENRTGEKEESGITPEATTISTKLLTLNKEWSLVQSLNLTQPEYEAPSYQAKVPAYTVASDLSNIENISQFKGFSKEQISKLVQNGFLVIPSKDSRSYYVYDSNEYMGIPNFVTSDTVLHIFHQFYDKSLMSIEKDYLYQDLELITKQMLHKSVLLLKELEDADLKALQEKNIIYFLVARMLLLGNTEVSEEVEQKLFDIARSEYELCQAAEGYIASPLIGKDLDYSQFKVRGHYTRSEELGKFFRTMMWFGTVPYALTQEKGDLNPEGMLQALLISYTTFSEAEGDCDAKLWSDIYQPTSLYVGLSDDINVFDINRLRLAVYGNQEEPDIFNDDDYMQKLKEAVKALPEPQIKAEFTQLSTPTGKQFRFMGQRYTLDGEILQNLIDSRKRPIPSSLDVMGVIGSQTAEDLLFQVYKPQKSWAAYTEEYKKLQKKIVGLETDTWKKNLYSGWLWAIQDILTEYDENSGMPFFMTTDAWKYKSLNTALGSYTELKHDSVLYGKQAAAEGGGPQDFAACQYVEPSISLYYKLLYLTDFTLSVLKDKGMLKEAFSEGAAEYKEYLNLLINCSKKELNNETLTEEEKKQLLWSGGKFESMIDNFIKGATGDISDRDVTDMLVTDISTYSKSYLTLGTGYFDHIYVVIPVGGKLYLSRGSVYSFYEFTGDTRLTDEEWWALQGITIQHTDYADFPEFGDPSDKMPYPPDWINHFKSEDDTVTVEPIEVDWDNLEE